MLSFECHGGRGGAGRPRSPRRHRPPQCTALAHALQLHNEYVDLKPDRAAKIEIMMVALLSKRFERLGGMIIPPAEARRSSQSRPRRRSEIGARFADLQTIKNRPCFADVGPIRLAILCCPWQGKRSSRRCSQWAALARSEGSKDR